MKKWLIPILLIGYTTFSTAQTKHQTVHTPKMVVGIKIEGLRIAHIKQLWKNFSIGGFRKIMTDGMVIEQMNHPILGTGTAADDATISTGSTPFYHGIVGNQYFDKQTNKATSILYDSKQKGIGTKDQLSAQKLLTTNIADEIRLKYPKAIIHSIGISPQSVIMYGGHCADAATWIDIQTKRWATSTYYNKGLYKLADDMNAKGECQRIMNKKWIPVASISSYRNPTNSGSRTIPFDYQPQETAKHKLAQWMNIPNANELVYQLAQRTIDSEPFGRDEQTDALFLQLTVKTPFQQTYAMTLAEQEDMYIRLDGILQRLIYKIEQKVGKTETLFFIIGSGGDAHAPSELITHQIPAGYFNAKSTLALLNSYLIAIYGQEKWIKGYYAKNIFIDKEKVEKKKINFTQMKEKISQFLLEFEGIQTVYTATEIHNMAGQASDERATIRNSSHPTTVGDFVFTLQPGWIEKNDNGTAITQRSNPHTSIPFILLQDGIEPHTKYGNFESTDIAPTICRLLHISTPNASIGKTIQITK